MKLRREALLVAVAGGLVVIGVNGAIFFTIFPGLAEAAPLLAQLSHLPVSGDRYEPPPAPDFLTALRARSVAASAEWPVPHSLLRYHATEVVPLASLTKLMTALVALGRSPNWSAVVTMASQDIRGGAARRFFPGDRLTEEDLWQAMLVGSDNDAAAAFVRELGLPEADFVAAMNRKAAAFGLERTRFTDPTGLDQGNVSTAREFAQVARVAFQNERIAATVAQPEVTIAVNGRPLVVRSSDQQLKSFQDVRRDGWAFVTGKTGYLTESGDNVALLGEGLSDRRILLVLLGAPTTEDRVHDVAALMRWAVAVDDGPTTSAAGR